jgi:hypothetical protein
MHEKVKGSMLEYIPMYFVCTAKNYVIVDQSDITTVAVVTGFSDWLSTHFVLLHRVSDRFCIFWDWIDLKLPLI